MQMMQLIKLWPVNKGMLIHTMKHVISENLKADLAKYW